MTTLTTLNGEVVILVNPTQLHAFFGAEKGPLFRHMFVTAEKVRRRAKEIAPRKTGFMADRIVKRIVSLAGEPVAIVGIDAKRVKYAVYVHEGAEPHDIYPKPGGRLVFFSQKAGRVIYMPIDTPVHHPGNKPNRFLIKALSAIR